MRRGELRVFLLCQPGWSSKLSFEDFLQLLYLGEPACHLPNSPSSDDGDWPLASEKTAFLVAAQNEFLLFFQKQSNSLAHNYHLEKTTQLQQGSLPAPNPHSDVMTHTKLVSDNLNWTWHSWWYKTMFTWPDSIGWMGIGRCTWRWHSQKQIIEKRWQSCRL